MPLPTASQCAIVVSVKAITEEGNIHVRSYYYRYRLGKARFPVARHAQRRVGLVAFTFRSPNSIM